MKQNNTIQCSRMHNKRAFLSNYSFLNSNSIQHFGQARRWRHAASSLIIAPWETAVIEYWWKFDRMILNCRYHVHCIIVSDISLKTRCFGAKFMSQNVYVYLQPLLRNAPWKLPSSVNATRRPFRHSRSFKVTVLGTNRMLIYDFLSVINTNLPHILQRF